LEFIARIRRLLLYFHGNFIVENSQRCLPWNLLQKSADCCYISMVILLSKIH